MLFWIGAGVLILVTYVLDAPYRRFLRQTSWGQLSKRFPGRYKGQLWKTCEAVTSLVSITDPDYAERSSPFPKNLFMRGLRVAPTPEGLHLAFPAGTTSILAAVIPWNQIRIKPCRTPIWIAYGKDGFVELACGDPPLYLQIERKMLGVYAIRAGG